MRLFKRTLAGQALPPCKSNQETLNNVGYDIDGDVFFDCNEVRHHAALFEAMRH
jgi:hypothetical protein